MKLSPYRSHSRHWHRNAYVYPVISRRSRGLSLGINLNPDKACNFDCVYCQVDRTAAPTARQAGFTGRRVDPERVRDELAQIIDDVATGALFGEPPFSDVPDNMRAIKDIAFSGDGEPTTCKQFRECVELTAEIKARAGLSDTKIVLITDACYLTRPEVEAGLKILDANNGQVWTKLDAGTEAYYQRVNRPNYPLKHVMENIIATARARSVVIQSLFMRLNDEPPDEAELQAYVDRFREITEAGGRIEYVQVYTVARRPAESYVTPLTDEEVDRIVELVENRAGVRTIAYYGAG